MISHLGKRNRGLSVVASLRQLISPDNLTKENVRTAVILGWCVEWVSKMSKLIGLIFFISFKLLHCHLLNKSFSMS